MSYEKCLDCQKVLTIKKELELGSCDKCFDKFCKIMSAHEECIAKDIEKQDKKDNFVWNELKKICSKELLAEIELEMNESNGGFDFEIVNKPFGTKDSYDDTHCNLWINQTTNGGYSGDDFAGDCYVKLPNGKYFKWHYEM